MKTRSICFSVTMFLFALALNAFAEGGSSVRGGGDPCENRFKVVRDGLGLWIHQGGLNTLDLPRGISADRYGQAMLSQMARASVRCVGPGDSSYPVNIDGVPKVCRFELGENGSQIICDYTKFLAASDTDQYVLVHHEYAGLAGIEKPDGSNSRYEISNQLVDSLTVQDGALRLVVRWPHTSENGAAYSKPQIPDTEERVISASIIEEVACATTTLNKVRCWRNSTRFPLFWTNPDLLNPPTDLKNPKEVIVSNSTACVTTDRGIRCWGDDASQLQVHTSSWRNPKNLHLFLRQDVNYPSRYSSELCAITDSGVKCTNGLEKNLPAQARMPDSLLVLNAYDLCVLKNGVILCSKTYWVLPDAASLPPELGQLRDVSFTPGGLNACGISTSKGLVCWGNPHFMAYLQPQPDLSDAIKVVATTDETCIITSDRHLKCWGEPYRNTNLVPDSFEVNDILISGTNKCVVNRVGKMRCVSDNLPNLGLTLNVPKEIRF